MRNKVVTTVVSAALAVDCGYKVVTHGLEITRALTFDEWSACGAALTAIVNRTNWAIGDWLVYGSGRGDYGAYYQEAARITGRSFESLGQYARVSASYPIAARLAVIPWSFYREALRLPAQDREDALVIAARNGWTKDGLAEFISTRDSSAPSVAKTLTVAVTPRRRWGGTWERRVSHHTLLRCPSCGFKFEPKRRARVVARAAG